MFRELIERRAINKKMQATYLYSSGVHLISRLRKRRIGRPVAAAFGGKRIIEGGFAREVAVLQLLWKLPLRYRVGEGT